MAADRVSHERILGRPLVGFLRQLRSSDPEQREFAAADIKDIARDGLGDLAPAVAGQLLLAFLIEDEFGPAEAALDTLGDVCMFNPIPTLILKPLQDRLASRECKAWEKDYLEAILDEFNPRPKRDE